MLTDCHIHLHLYVLPVMCETQFHTHITRGAELWLCILNVMFLDTLLFHSIPNCVAQVQMKILCIKPVVKYVQQSFG